MNEFERAACRVLGVILFGVLVILYLQLISCTKPVPEPDAQNLLFNTESNAFFSSEPMTGSNNLIFLFVLMLRQ